MDILQNAVSSIVIASLLIAFGGLMVGAGLWVYLGGRIDLYGRPAYHSRNALAVVFLGVLFFATGIVTSCFVGREPSP